MIKDQFNVNVGEFNIMERTGRIDQFKKWYNIFPVKLFEKRIIKVVEGCVEMIEADGLDKEIKNLEGKTEMVIDIHELEVLYTICQTHLFNGIELKNILSKTKLTRRQKRKLKYNTKSLKSAIPRIKQVWGEINGMDDLLRFKDEIERRKDKFYEMYPEKPKKENGKAYLIDIATSYAAHAGGVSAVSKMTLPELASLKKEIDAKISAEVKKIDELKHKR